MAHAKHNSQGESERGGQNKLDASNPSRDDSSEKNQHPTHTHEANRLTNHLGAPPTHTRGCAYLSCPIWLRLTWILILLLPIMRAIGKAIRIPGEENINSWAMTELMISNTAGFVRRGLGGSLLLWLHQFSPSPFLQEFGLLLALTTIFASSLLILKGCLRLSPFDGFLIMFSPLSYPTFLSYATETVFRKDALAILFIIVALLGLLLSEHRQYVFLLVMACIILPVLTFIHEMIPFFCLVPLLLIYAPLLLRRIQSSSRAIIVAAALLLPCLATLALIRANSHPTLPQVVAMCQAWQQYYPALACSPIRDAGTFSTMADQSGSLQALEWIHSEPYSGRFRIEGVLVIFYLCAMAIGPLGRLVAVQTSRNRIQGGCVALLIGIFVLIPTTPMYWLGTDFGRWLGMATTIFVIITCNRRFTLSLVNALQEIGFFHLPLHRLGHWQWQRSLYANSNGLILLINFCLIPQAYHVLIWEYSPQLRILLKPFGL
ncbi:hypothetical protein NZK32_01410 [Cyanobium sp. FGCU-52]|nr:hypothetical protein [Cyanobium sp. FGCU52]